MLTANLSYSVKAFKNWACDSIWESSSFLSVYLDTALRKIKYMKVHYSSVCCVNDNLEDKQPCTVHGALKQSIWRALQLFLTQFNFNLTFTGTKTQASVLNRPEICDVNTNKNTHNGTSPKDGLWRPLLLIPLALVVEILFSKIIMSIHIPLSKGILVFPLSELWEPKLSYISVWVLIQLPWDRNYTM